MTKSKAYREGYNSSKKGLNWVDNPYPHGSIDWQTWINGRGEYGDMLLIKAIKNADKILKELRK